MRYLVEEKYKLEDEVKNLEKFPDEQFKAHNHFLSRNYPQHFAELAAKLGVENITLDKFVQLLANKC